MASPYRPPSDFLVEMLTTMETLGAPITDFNAGSVARSLFESVGAALSLQSLVVEQLDRDSYLDTADGEALDRKGQDYLVTRKAAVSATGTVRVTRQNGDTAIIVPARSFQLSTRPTPGVGSVAVILTEDVVLSQGVLTVDVPAQAVVGGVMGNLTAGQVLIPQTGVMGIASDGGFVTQTAFRGGVEAEADALYRERIRTSVQGRVNGTEKAFQAATEGVPGVFSSSVLAAGSARNNGSVVPVGSVEVYFKGDASLLGTVQSAADQASVLNQNVTAFVADAEPVTVGVTVSVLAGTDTVATAKAVGDAVQAVVNAVPVGGRLFYADAITAIDAVENVVGLNIPFAQFRKKSSPAGTAADIVLTLDRYPSLAPADLSVVVTTI